MKIKRQFTKAGEDVYQQVNWVTRASKITNPDGSVVFQMNDAQVPDTWSQLATDIMVSKYFRKAGVPQYDAQANPVTDNQGNPVTGPERSARQVIERLVGCWRYWGERYDYFDTADDAQAFADELAHMLLHQMAAPNSPQWFNTGLNWAYGMTGPAQGHYVVDPDNGEVRQADDAYTNPQPHACFIQSIDDDLVNEGGIMDLWVREARLFKYGSGTGTNFSRIRADGESLSGGGKSSGLMSFLKIGDRAAGAIKSGGTTRRAAKMVCLDLDHPDIEQFIDWKVREELKVAALAEGIKHLPAEQRELATKMDLQLDTDFNGEAYATVSGQNSNNSIRIPNKFFQALKEDDNWELTWRTTGQTARRVRARDLWDRIGFAAWRCADPGVQYDTTINQWHTCPTSGRINASNPCSEYMFLDNTACNLASINLLKFYDAQHRAFDIERFEHATRLWTIVLEISVLMAAYPSKEVARLSYEYRTLGLGYANLGAMLMQAGLPYDSESGRAIAGAIASIMTGRAYATSAELAGKLGPFAGYFKNREHMLRVIRNHRRAAYGVDRDTSRAAGHELGGYEGLEVPPVPINADALEGETDCRYGMIDNATSLLRHARAVWDQALKLGEINGYRNAQVSVIAPTGTIGLLMDCDTTGVEPDFALVKFKKLAGGGYFKIANQSLKPALHALGYNDNQITQILRHVMGQLSVNVPMPDQAGRVDPGARSFEQFLRTRGLNDADIQKINNALAAAMDISFVLNPMTLGEQAIKRLGLTDGADVRKALGLTRKQIDKLNLLICGAGTVEGAPMLAEEHLAVFDCANRCGRQGKRYIAPQGHIRMMAAVQPFISGAISKTINMPGEATVDQIKQAYQLSWELGLKANALYRDGSKLSQPLNATADQDKDTDEPSQADQMITEQQAKEEIARDVAQVSDALSRQSDTTAINSTPVEKIVERIVERPLRRRLPDTRSSITHKFSVAGHEGYLTVGLYDDQMPGELFITMAKEGSTIGGLMDSLGTAISVALQYGVPVDSLVSKFTHQRFEPAGMTDNRDIPFAKSLVDYIFRWLGMQFIPGYREANAPKRPGSSKAATPTAKSPVKPAATTGTETGQDNANGHGATRNKDGNGKATAVSRHTMHMVTHRIVPDGGSRLTGKTTSETPAKTCKPLGHGSGDLLQTSQPAATGMLDAANSQMMGDAPACDVCGSITIRNGTCYKCLNCGNSLGCS